MSRPLSLCSLKSHPTLSWLLGGLLWLMASWPLPALAHKASDAYWQVSRQGSQVRERLDVALRDLDRDLDLDTNGDRQLTWGELRPRWPAVADWIGAQVQWAPQAGVRCQALPAGPAQFDQHSDGAYAVFVRDWQCDQAPSTLSLTYRLFASTDPQHRGIVKLDDGGRIQSRVMGPDQPQATWTAAPNAEAPTADLAESASTSGLWSFFGEGLHHILIGTDHLLFLLSLLLPSVLIRQQGPGSARWVPAPTWPAVVKQVLGIVTAFTVAHSLTLALAVSGWVQLPSRWVESIIAASVVLAALNNLRPVVQGRRWLMTLVFGFIHGFGFAGALQDLGLSGWPLVGALLSFNAGVEIGQLALVALFMPLAWLLRPYRAYRRWGLGLGSTVIAMVAVLWLIERAADLRIISA